MREQPVLILVHGGPGANDHSHYKPFFTPLAGDAQIVYYDHRGNGRSDRSDASRWNLPQWADDLRGLCDQLGIVKPIVLGTSFGGFVAQEYATRYPDHPGKLILSSTAGRLRFDRVGKVMRRLGGERAQRIAEQFWQSGAPSSLLEDYVSVCSPLYMRRAPADALVRDIASRTVRNTDVVDHFTRPGGEAHTINLLPKLDRIRCPTLILAGEDDPITTIEDAEDMANAISPSLVTFERFPDCGHPTYMDAPQRTFRLIRQFLAT
jgi:proline iminopeptidase